MSTSVIKVTGLSGKPLSLALQNVLRGAAIVRAARMENIIDEEDILAALCAYGDTASTTLSKVGGIKPKEVYKKIGLDGDKIPVSLSEDVTQADLTLDLRKDFGVMGGYYLRKASELAELTNDTEVRPEHLLFTSLATNRTARIPTIVRDLGGPDYDPVEAVRKALCFNKYAYNLFNAKQQSQSSEWADPRCII